MGIYSAMFSGVSGLNTNSEAMSVIGNNLANTNTLGYKSARCIFSDLLASSVYGSGGMSQVGRGVGLSTVDSIYKQGTFENTSSDTDVAIEGSGFFVLKEPGNSTTFYSRAGAFSFNEDGYLITPEGLRVQGKQFSSVNNDELLPNDPTDVRVANIGLIAASPTTELSFTTNLSENSPLVDTITYPAIDPTVRASYNYSASAEIFDSLGVSHLITAYWRLTDDLTNTWEAAYSVDNAATATALPGTMVFNSIGEASAPFDYTISIPAADWGNGAASSTIDIHFDCTQYDSASIVIGQEQNGYGTGELTNVAINDEGIVVASYSNGRHINISQLVLAKFQNPGGLLLAGSNRYTAPAEAGAVLIGLPGPERGKLITNSLEQSNVDMGQEFVKMITTQRGFQANSKIITTVDDMLSDLINLKR
ncbi:flagellar hook protein FlgE [Desulfobulbus elongatus]|uniref:flagellar hook protein FlgE n=1 Tax=Desulfobulbus elongatus TaxID=53332 RepID=UPI00047FECBE|nr:flagellar hook protein FlgE [Desulfobulbus elongatus]